MDAEELGIFRAGLRRAVERRSAAARDAALVDLGWPEAVESDPRAAVGALFELQGAANATSSALGAVVASTVGVGLDGWPRGPAVMLPAFGSSSPPGRREDGSVVLAGVALSGHAEARQLAVVVGEGEPGLVRLRADSMVWHAPGGIDPSAGLSEVTGRVPLPPGAPDAASWSRAVCLARLALGHELVGAARTMLDLACRHALERVQGGRPIAGYQAVRHRLAEALVAVEAATAGLAGAWDDADPGAAALAKALAGRAAATVARHAQQVLAGTGFTAEHPFHRYFKRCLVLDQLFGSSATLSRDLGARVLERRMPPPLLPL